MVLPSDTAGRARRLLELASPIAARNYGVVSLADLRGIWLLQGGDAASLLKAIDYCIDHKLLTVRGYGYVV